VLLEVGVTTQTRVLYILPVGHEDPVEKAECIVYIQYWMWESMFLEVCEDAEADLKKTSRSSGVPDNVW